jgi:quinoprotein glucose dehydrogenase
MRKATIAAASLLAALGVAGVADAQAPVAQGAAAEWRDWGGNAARTHYSPLNQITAANVAGLRPAWVWSAGTYGRSWETRPLMVHGLLIIAEPGTSDVLALVPETGKEVWRFRARGPALDRRGFAYWGGDGTMRPRIVAIWGRMMHGIDPMTGQASSDWPATGFDLGLPNPANNNVIAGGLQPASPPLIYKNLIITTGATGFLPSPAQPSDPHAHDLRTGKLVWTARVIPGANEPGGDSWGPQTQAVIGSGAWGTLTVDEESGTIYVPTDAGSPDYVGIWRPGDNAGAGSTVAIDAETGRVKWRFQNLHHDIFDLDTNAPPSPVTIMRNGKPVKMVVQATKQGMIWILDANTGKPIFPYEERPVPQSRIPGERTSPTQPFTILPPPLVDANIRRDNLTQLSPRNNAECKALYDANKLEDVEAFSPPRPGGAWSMMSIGAIGGVDWGGGAIDRARGLAVFNIVSQPTMITVTESNLAVRGNGNLRSTTGNVRFMDHDGRSCAGGKHGELVAINLATGRIAWRVPLGSLEEQFGPQVRAMGTSSIGPPLATRGGLVFAHSTDDRLHAYDIRNGRLLWQAKMSASSNAGAMTYMGKDGRQYVVIPAGGPGNARRPSPRNNVLYHQTLVAFALPRPGESLIDLVTPYPTRSPGPGQELAAQGGAGNFIIVPVSGRGGGRGGADAN